MNDNKIDRKLSVSIIFFFIIQSANSTIKTLLPDLGDAVNSLLSEVCGVLILIMLFSCMRFVSRRSSMVMVSAYVIFIAVYFISIFQSILRNAPINVLLKESMLWTMVWWLPMGLIIYSIRDKSVLYNTLVKWSYLLSIVTLLSVFSYFTAITQMNQQLLDKGNYNMFFSYMLLLPLIIHLNEIFEHRGGKNYIWLIIEFVAILLYGSRGALMCILAFLLMKVLLDRSSVGAKWGVIGFSTVAVVAFVIGANIVFQDLADVGLTSRTLEMFTEGTVSQSEGRERLMMYSIDLIKDRPLFGYGLGGEFYVLYEKAYGVAKSGEFSSLTPHNGILQLMLNFGFFIGGIISLLIIFTIPSIRKVKDEKARNLLIILCAVYIIPSMTVGDGIFIKPGIALYFFLLLSNNKHQHNIRITYLNNEYCQC